MISDPNKALSFDHLRQQAEKLIAKQPTYAFDHAPDVLKLIHELRVYQAELEIQNEELKKTQLSLSDLHQEYADLYEFAPCGYITLNARGIITRANLRAVTLLGANRTTLSHCSLSQFIDPAWQPAFIAARQRCAETGEKQSLDFSILTDQRDKVWVMADIEVERDKGARVIEWRVVLTDISLQKRAESALKGSEERFRTLYEKAPVAYQSLDENGNIISVNETWLSCLGYSRNEVIGHNFCDFLTVEDQENFQHNFPRFKAVGEILGIEFLMQKKDGTSILVSFRGKTGRDEEGEFRQTHCVFHDITASREAEKEQQAMRNQLRHAKQMESIGTLAGGVAHEFNNLLAIMIGYNDLALAELPESGDVVEFLTEVRTAGIRARDVIQQLLTFSRHHVAHQEPLQLGTSVENVVKLLRSTIPANISIITDIAEDLSPIIGDINQLDQVIINLCGNAKDALLERGGSIHISVENYDPDKMQQPEPTINISGPQVKLTVADDGCGIDQEVLEKIFEPYYTTKEVGKGTGIGLSVVYGIVQQHQGNIQVESHPNRGTSFQIYLPAHLGKVEQKIEEQTEPPTGNERILFIDDEPSAVNLMNRLLSRLGYAVKGFTNPEEAIELLKSDPELFDLVVTDMTMAEMTGDQVVKEVVRIRADMPIILCTGYSEKLPATQTLLDEKFPIVMKPFTTAKIASVIRQTLDGTVKDSTS